MTFGHVLIRASAGTGKTYQLSNRFLGLVALGVYQPQVALVKQRHPQVSRAGGRGRPDQFLRLQPGCPFGWKDRLAVGAILAHNHQAVTAGIAAVGENCL